MTKCDYKHVSPRKKRGLDEYYCTKCKENLKKWEIDLLLKEREKARKESSNILSQYIGNRKYDKDD